MTDEEKGASKADFVLGAFLYLLMAALFILEAASGLLAVYEELNRSKLVLTSWLTMIYWTTACVFYWADLTDTRWISRRMRQSLHSITIALAWPFIVVSKIDWQRIVPPRTGWVCGQNQERVSDFLSYNICGPAVGWLIRALAWLTEKFALDSDDGIADKGLEHDCDDGDTTRSPDQQDIDQGPAGGSAAHVEEPGTPG